MKPRKYAGQIPKFWQPKLAKHQCLDAKIIHWDLIDRFSQGAANKNDLWDWIETGYTYCKMIELHQKDGTVFTQESIEAVSNQIDIYESVIERYKRTGRVGFSAQELIVARAAASVFDSLIDIDRNGIAVCASKWSVQIMHTIRAIGSKALQRGVPA